MNWKPVPYEPFDKYYEINEEGVVRSKKRIIEKSNGRSTYLETVGGRIIATRTNGVHPHLFVTLRVKINDEFVDRTAYIHKMVALCFIPKVKDKPLVSHIDDDYSNNHYSNLIWSDQSYVSKRTMEKYPVLRDTLKNNNIKSGYYNKLRKKKI